MTREIIRHHDAEDLAASTAARLVTTLAQVQADFGSASLVLTGGRIAGSLLFSLADPIAAEALDWSRLDLWWGDERYLPAGDVERNDWLADTRLLSQVAIPPSSVHRIAGPDTSASAQDAAEAYAREMAECADRRAIQGRPAFDVVLLSIGPDGHVASLFPETSTLESSQSAIAVLHSPKPPPVRVTLGFSALNDCTEAWLLASGEEKATVVDLMLTQGGGYLQIPAAGISGIGRTLLLIDESAAGKMAADVGRREG
jgi:6-phosphogluconolactonase